MNKITTAILTIALVAILGGLAGWYLFLRSRTNIIKETDTARGIGLSIPLPGSGLIGTTNTVSPSQSLPPHSDASSPYANGTESDTASMPAASLARGDNTSQAVENTAAGSTTPSTAPKISHVTKAAVAGFGFVTSGGNAQLYFVDRATGHVFSVDPVSGAVTRFTNTTIPKVYEAYIGSGRIIERSLADDGSITTFSGIIDAVHATSTTASLSGQMLEKNILSISLPPTQSKPALFYLRPSASGGIEGVIAKLDGTGQKIIFTSPLAGWRPYQLEDGRTIIAQKPASDVVGFAYEVGKGGVLIPLVPQAPGLSVLPRAFSSALLWSSFAGETMTLSSRPDAHSAPKQLSIHTIAEKCAWVPPPHNASAKNAGALIAYCAVPTSVINPHFLENWYQGAVHTNDEWWMVDVSSGSSRSLALKGMWDVQDPIIDPSGMWVAFRNGHDDTLWVVRVGQ